MQQLLLPELQLQQQLVMRGRAVQEGHEGRQGGGRALLQPLLQPDDLPKGGLGNGAVDLHQQP